MPTDVAATVFERRVWEELRRIPYGATRTYSEIARAIGRPSAVRAVARGEAVCPPRLCLALFRFVAQAAIETPAQTKQESMHGLTIRQQQLISLVARGLTNKEIASQLNLSEFTIKNHLHRIMKQVEVETRYDMVNAARASGYPVIVQSLAIRQ